jgi:hypothetical protein
MTTQQYFELSAEARQYWSAENFMNRMTEATIDDLTWENKALTQSLQVEQARVRELTEQLTAAEKKIRELTGVPEPEPEPEETAAEVFRCELVRQYCCMDSYEEVCVGDNYDPLVMDREINGSDNYLSPLHIEDFDLEATCNTAASDELTDGEAVNYEVANDEEIIIEDYINREEYINCDEYTNNYSNSFFGTLPTGGEALEPENFQNNENLNIIYNEF